jgi:hypothetical protein
MYQTFEFIQDLIEKGIKPILYFGIDYGEVRRAPRIAYNYKHNVDVFDDGVEVRFPLIGEVDGLPVSGEQLLYGTDYLTSDKMPKIYNNMVYGCLEKQNFVMCESSPKIAIKEEWGIKLPRMYDMGFILNINFKGDDHMKLELKFDVDDTVRVKGSEKVSRIKTFKVEGYKLGK